MPRENSIIKKIDWFTVFLYLSLVVFGWMNIYAATYQFEQTSVFNLDYRYSKQMVWILASIVLILIIMLLDRRFFSFFAYPIYGITIFLLIATLVFGTVSHGSKSWLLIGGFSIQPAEFAKFATALAVAKYGSYPGFDIRNFKKVAAIAALFLLPPLLIILQNDTGSALVYASFIFVLYREGLSGTLLLYGLLIAIVFVLALLIPLQIMLAGIAGIGLVVWALVRQNLKEVLVIVLTGGGIYGIIYAGEVAGLYTLSFVIKTGAVLAILTIIGVIWAYWRRIAHVKQIILAAMVALVFTTSVDYFFHNILSDHQRSRINVLLGVKQDLQGAGYNIHQSKIAIGSGGLTGKGFLKGTQTKLDFVPEQSTDFIFCTIGEEWGFVGTTGVIALLVILLIRLIILAERQRSNFSRIYGYSVVAILFFHTAVNIGMTIGLAPVIGIPLPFFSYGGSSLWGFTILLFIFIRLDASKAELL